MPMKSIPILIAALVFVISSTPVSAADSAAGPIKIGTILILSGEGASWGVASKNGVDLAIEKVNAAGGVLGRPLSVLHQDDQGDAKRSIAAFRQLTEIEGVNMIIGPNWSTLGLPLIDSATRTKTVMISPSLGAAKFNESSPFLFNTWPHDYILSQKLADYVFAKGHRSVAVVGAEEVWVKEQTAAFVERFEKNGGRIVYRVEPLPGTVDLKTEALMIKKSGADAMVSTTDGLIIGSLAAKSLRELGAKLPMYSITLDQAAIDASQGGFEGLEFLTFLTPAAEFKVEYQARFKAQIDIGADSAYDAVMLLVKAISETKSTDPAVLAEWLGKLKEFRGASGVLVSDGKRGFTKADAVKRVVGGKPEDIGQ